MASTAPTIQEGPLLTADGIPLKVSLQKSLRQSRNKAIMLVAPPLLFLVIVFVIPIGDMLLRSVDDKLINQVLPRTFEVFEAWDKESEPSEEMFEALFTDLKAADKIERGKAPDPPIVGGEDGAGHGVVGDGEDADLEARPAAIDQRA